MNDFDFLLDGFIGAEKDRCANLLLEADRIIYSSNHLQFNTTLIYAAIIRIFRTTSYSGSKKIKVEEDQKILLQQEIKPMLIINELEKTMPLIGKINSLMTHVDAEIVFLDLFQENYIKILIELKNETEKKKKELENFYSKEMNVY